MHENIEPNKIITDVVMLYEAWNLQLGGKLLKINYPKLTVMRGVEHTIYLVFNDVSKRTTPNQIITAHK